MLESTLAQALRAYDERRFLEAFSLAHQARHDHSDDARLILLFARLAALGGDLIGAVATYRALLAQQSDDQANAELTDLLARRPNPARAARIYSAQLIRNPDIEDDRPAPGAQAPLSDSAEVHDHLSAVLVDDPVHAGALACLANLAVREDRYVDAAHGYRRALALEPDNAERRLRLAELLFDLNDVDASYDEFERVFAVSPMMRTPNGIARVLVLFAPVPWRMNTRFEFIVCEATTSIDFLYVTHDDVFTEVTLHRYDTIISCIGSHDVAFEARASVCAWMQRTGIEVINHPEAVAQLSRERLGDALEGLTGFACARATRIPREKVREYPLPLLVRPPDSQAGRGLARLRTYDDVRGYLAEHLEDEFDCCAFVDYRSVDGLYRKYRVVVINGIAYPYHLAISESWMVHYVSAGMADHEERRREEELFLADPSSCIPNFAEHFLSLATQLGLEYLCVDCTMLENAIFVFEIDPTMLIYRREGDSRFAYRTKYVEKIASALGTWVSLKSR